MRLVGATVRYGHIIVVLPITFLFSSVMDERREMDTETSSRSRDSVDELQLAALLGKSLLKRNNELEQTLRRLQEYAEETMSANQTLNRQVGELRNSLQFSNESCEQLEQKAEELERNNIRLQKLCDFQQTLLTQKTSTLVDLQKDYCQLKLQHEQLQIKMAVELTDTVRCELDHKLHSKNVELDGKRKLSDNSDRPEFRNTLPELTLKLQNVSFQKQKIERELEGVIIENHSLVKALERAEMDIAELQAKLRCSEENSLESLSTPKSECQSFSSAMLPLALCDDPKSPLTFQPAHQSICKSPKESAVSGLSLFGELDIQYRSLKQQYQELVEECTCSASLSHKEWHCPNSKNPPASLHNGVKSDAPFKELFDEVFATLKQTTLVADKLIERKNCK